MNKKTNSSKLKTFLKNRDLFGYPIKLNFNRNGDSHKTVIGGVLSIFLKVLYYLYMAYLLHKMFNHEDDRTYSYEFMIDENK